VAGGGTWTSNGVAIHALLNNMKTAVNALLTFVTTEAGLIVTTDKSAPNQAQNAAAVSNINTVLIPALNTWIALSDFESSGAGPSKMHSTQMTALSTALSNRSTFIATRIGQLNTTLGTITQNVTDGSVTGSGLYFTRYNFLVLRLNLLSGSLSQLSGAKSASAAQTNVSASIKSAANTYGSILPTTALAANANGTPSINVVDSSKYSIGDTVYVMADDQVELQRAVKSISGKMITLNDVVPAKYTISSAARLYKDLS
jgi:hypothetical protein